jgi:hypothetical protein
VEVLPKCDHVFKRAKCFRKPRGIVPNSYPGSVNVAMSDKTEPRDVAGAVNQRQPPYQLFVGLKKKKPFGMARNESSGIA